MKYEDVASKLRGVKAMLHYISEVKGNIADSEFAFSLMAEEIEECIEELEKR